MKEHAYSESMARPKSSSTPLIDRAGKIENDLGRGAVMVPALIGDLAYSGAKKGIQAIKEKVGKS